MLDVLAKIPQARVLPFTGASTHGRAVQLPEQTGLVSPMAKPHLVCGGRRTNHNHKRSQCAMTFSLLPFAFTGLVNPSAWIGYVVLINGVLCHGGAALQWRYARYACDVDTLCNFVLCIYVNLETHWQPYTVLLTAITLLVYLNNGDIKKVACPWVHTWVHVLFVQWLLCFLLYVFESKSWFTPSSPPLPSLPPSVPSSPP